MLFTAFITGCCLTAASRDPLLQAEIIAASTTEEVTKEKDQEVLTIDLCELFGFNKEDIQTPEIIPTDVLPDPKFYAITTRIVIEGQPIQFENEGEQIEAMWWARQNKDIKRDLANAEQIYAKIGLKFVVTEVVYREFNPNMLQHFIDANIHQGVLTITYMLPNGFQWDGISSAPWEPITRGIVLHYLSDEWTLAHEVGHYFGLRHPFDDDFVKDTPQQEQKYCAGLEFSTSNCHNIMNYCDHNPKHVSPGQIDRFKRFLRSKRMDHFDRERTDLYLRGHQFPTPSGTNVSFIIAAEDDKIDIKQEKDE
ncbi:MAG: M43 family zinc metalloprotease [Promethearchaeota archaeon]